MMKNLHFTRTVCGALAALSMISCSLTTASAKSLTGSLRSSLITTSSSLVSDSTRKQVTSSSLCTGYYVFAAYGNQNRVANVTFASVQEDRATLGISEWDAETNEIFYVERVGEGNYVTIAPSYCTSLVLNALLGADCVVGQSVTLHRKQASDTASWWLPTRNSDGTYTFTNKASGLVIDLANGDCNTIGNGLLCYTKNGYKAAQSWYVYAVGDPHAEQKTPDYLGTTTEWTSPVPSGCKFSKKSYDSSWYGYHDINKNVSTSTPVYAVSSGTAYYYQCNTNGKLRSYGYYVKLLTDNGGYEIRYCHLSRFVGVSPTITIDSDYPCSGAKSSGYLGSRRVSTGDTLAYIGQTGNASGVHLHLEVYKISSNGSRTRVDPTTLFSGLV